MNAKISSRSGFTLIEILISIAIFGFAIMAIVGSRTLGLRNSVESRRMFEATQVAARILSEKETEFQTKIDKDGLSGALGTYEGSGEAPFESFKWKAELRESTLEFTSEVLSDFLIKSGMNEDLVAAEVEKQRLILGNLNKNLKTNFAELEVVVEWEEFGRKYSLPIVTHLIPKKPKITLSLDASE
jgi:prepilin-type N-terminal cleavage/methylation domain-containing protein